MRTLTSPRRLSEAKQIVLAIMGTLVAVNLFMGLPGLIGVLTGAKVYPVLGFDWWWLWAFK